MAKRLSDIDHTDALSLTRDRAFALKCAIVGIENLDNHGNDYKALCTLAYDVANDVRAVWEAWENERILRQEAPPAPRPPHDAIKLETAIGEVRDAVIILDQLIDNLPQCRVSPGDQGYREGFTTLHLTDDQFRAIDAANARACLTSRELNGFFDA